MFSSNFLPKKFQIGRKNVFIGRRKEKGGLPFPLTWREVTFESQKWTYLLNKHINKFLSDGWIWQLEHPYPCREISGHRSCKIHKLLINCLFIYKYIFSFPRSVFSTELISNSIFVFFLSFISTLEGPSGVFTRIVNRSVMFE